MTCLNILFSCLLVVALALCAVCSGCNFFMVWFQVGSGHRQILSKMLVGSRADSLGVFSCRNVNLHLFSHVDLSCEVWGVHPFVCEFKSQSLFQIS